jgi:hypothetical protein
MKALKLLVLLSMCVGFALHIQAQELSYYLPDSVRYNASVPTPESVIGHKVGEWHITHDKLVYYMKALAAASDRIQIEETGRTYEGRPQLLLTITAPANHKNLEQIRQQHLKLADPSASSGVNLDNMPAVVWMGYSIHGNEPSGSNAALLAAYYLAAAEGPQIDDLLANTVILLDPSFNPDGLNRFATWVNMNKSHTQVSDPSAREFNEPWPGGRTNHYWFDLNRDWLPVQHLESRARIKKYQQWLPNILTDHHEMGTNATYFFQPGVPSRTNPNTPPRNQELTGQIAMFHAEYLNRIGSFYYTKEGFDDFYYGKGSTYPDIHGGVGILFEQASSRGHAQDSENGILTFPFTIRNQFTTTLSTLEAARKLRKNLLEYQRDFYRDARNMAQQAATKAYIFGDSRDHARNFHLLEMLRRHQIEVYELKSRLSTDGHDFEPGSAYVIPTAQPQYRLIKAMFEKTLQYRDSLFYDVTTWTIPLAFNIPHAELTTRNFSNNLLGNKIEEPTMPKGKLLGGAGAYAYLFEWDEYYAPRALYQLQAQGVLAKVATRPTEVQVEGGGKRQFNYGTIMIPVQSQNLSGEALQSLLAKVAAENAISVYAATTGMADSGSDLGSRYFANLRKPEIMLFSGESTTSYDVGELWHLLDYRFGFPVTLADVGSFDRIDANKYNVMIMASGSYYAMSKSGQEKLRSWLLAGGVLIAAEDAVNWVARSGLSDVGMKSSPRRDSASVSLPYIVQEDKDGAQQMGGAIFKAELDLTHPLGFGYRRPYISVFKNNKIFMRRSRSAYASPLVYGNAPLESGYISRQNYDQVKNSSVVNVNALGRGRIISLADNLNFRAFWYGGTKLFMNSIFFGHVINASSVRGDEDDDE